MAENNRSFGVVEWLFWANMRLKNLISAVLLGGVRLWTPILTFVTL
jgi:hypothetical protein